MARQNNQIIYLLGKELLWRMSSLGIDTMKDESDGEHLYPTESEEGIRVISINLFNEKEDEPVIWRGPLLAKAIDQFWEDTDWGELDYLIVDFPPGTSDVALTAFQNFPFSGIVEVAQARSIRWSALPEAVKKDAEALAREVQLGMTTRG